MEIYCDKCKKDFEIDIKEKKYNNGIVEAYFICPHCKKRYTSFFTNRYIRIKQKQVRDLYNKINNCIDMKERIELLEKIDNIQTDIKINMDKLKNSMLGTQ